MLKFRKSDHSYWYDGKRMTGVTTVIGVIGKDLANWAANCAVDCMLAGGTEKEARVAHLKIRDDAASAGTDCHKEAETIINFAIKHNDGYLHEEDLKHESPQIQMFVKWALRRKVQFITTEQKVYSVKNFYAGTFDMVFKMNGKVYIGDIKTRKYYWNLKTGIFWTDFLQMGGYAVALKEMKPEVQLDGLALIRLGKDGTFEIGIKKDIKKWMDGFLLALGLYRIKGEFEKK